MKKFILFILAIIAFSCSDDAIPTNPENFTELPVDTDINFMPEERYSTNTIETPSLRLKLITAENFGCSNYGLSTTVTTDGNELIIKLNAIIEPEMCLTSIGPAMASIDLPENINKITLINNNIIDTYSIDITQENISISPIESNFTHSLYATTFRIPENSFAYVCGTNTNNTNIYDEFFSILEQNPNFVEFQFEGDGRIPYPESASGHYVDHPSKYFIYSDFEEFNNLGNILNNYAAENIEQNSGVSIAIYSWNNIKYYSWITN